MQARFSDVDLLLSVDDATALCAREAIAIEVPLPDTRFRSRLFARWSGGPLTIELMAGLSVAIDGAWRPVAPVTRVRIGAVYVPDRPELISILHGFGRPKDLVRAAALSG